jgi:serine/threonine-protein kinase
MLVCPRCSAPCGETHSFCFACGGALEHDKEREDPLLGRTLPGGYRVTHVVGIGGMGRVYCAEQVALGRTVAVKVVHPHLADDELAAARFLNEARTASRLSHPNSVAIFDFGRTEQGQPYIVMEYLRGRDLARVAHDEGPLPMRRVTDVLRQTLAALEEAHAMGIIHRDLKPDNIVLEPLRSGLDFVKVVDFGLAKILEEAPAPSPIPGRGALTRPGLVCGTPEYMSPEQGRGDTLDGRADLYSVGIVLFELLTGKMPFWAETATKTLLLQLNEPAPDPRNIAPERGIPASFATIALRALAKSREDRFQTAREFSDALVQAMSDLDGRAAFDSPPQTSIRCRACGALNMLGQKFCGDCGSAISSSVVPGRPRPSPSPRAPDAVGPTMTRTPAVGGGLHSLPLTARATALDWLESRRHEAEASFALAHVVGEAGAGKTRLVHEFGARCASRGDVVATVGPDPAWAKIGGYTAREAIRALLAIPEDQAVDAIALGAPASAGRGIELLWAKDDQAIPVSPGECRRSVADALRWAMSRAAEGAGQGLVVLVVDDIDFIDGASRNAFVDLTADPPSSGGLLVVTYAPGTSPVEPLEQEAWALEPLPVEAFADQLPPRYAEQARPLWPLHVEQLMAWSRESKEPPPDRLADLIARRTERLAPDARHTLHALSVWGDDATAEGLRNLLPARVDLDAALDVLDKAKIVSIDDRGLRIEHPLVRRVVASTIPAGRKRELFARVDELRPDAPLEIRARQAMHGGSALEGLSLLEVLAKKRAAAGDTAGSVSALRHALDMTRRELHRGELDDPLGAMLVFSRKLAEALAASEQWNDAEGVLREALGNAPPTSEHRARLLAVLAHVAQSRSHPAEARRYLDEAMRVARQSESRELLPMLQKIEASLRVA